MFRCRICDRYECCDLIEKLSCIIHNSHAFVNTASLLIDDGNRVVAQSLIAPKLELIYFLNLAATAVLAPILADAVGILDEIMQVSGGQLGITMFLIRTLFKNSRSLSSGLERSKLDPEKTRQFLFSAGRVL